MILITVQHNPEVAWAAFCQIAIWNEKHSLFQFRCTMLACRECTYESKCYMQRLFAFIPQQPISKTKIVEMYKICTILKSVNQFTKSDFA